MLISPVCPDIVGLAFKAGAVSVVPNIRRTRGKALVFVSRRGGLGVITDWRCLYFLFFMVSALKRAEMTR